MHVVFWTPAWPLERYQNGIITYVHAMKGELESRGHKISILTGELHSGTKESGVHEVRYGIWRHTKRRLRRFLMAAEYDLFDFSAAIAAKIERINCKHPIDIIEMEESFGWFADVARRTRLPVIVRLHGPTFLTQMGAERETRFARERVAREGTALREAHTITSPSSVTLQRTVERYRLSPGDSRVIVNPFSSVINLPRWRLEECDRQVILFVGRFDLCKGADVALSAFRLLLQERPSLRLCFVGPDLGWTAPDGSRMQFASYAEKMFPGDLREQVVFRGALPHSEVARLRARSMVTLLASRWENQSYALLEAMSQACPIVSTDAGGCSESITDGLNGRLARSECAEDFAAKISAVLNDPESARAMGEAARRHVIEHHSVSKIAGQTLEAYRRQILSVRGRRAE